MKKLLLSLLLVATAFAQTNVQKGAGNVLSNGSIVVPSGVSISATGTGQIIATNTSGAVVNSIIGTSGQITASAATGNVTLSIPADMTGIASIAPASGNNTLTLKATGTGHVEVLGPAYLYVNNSTNAVSATTGGFQVVGGAGIQGDIYTLAGLHANSLSALTGNHTLTLSPSGTGSLVLSNLTSNGYVTTSGGTGTTSISTSSDVLDGVGSTRGSLLYRGASGWSALTPGTSTYVLTSNGAGADPTWAAGGTAGAVVGPSSAVDGNVALFNGTTGKLIKDGGTLGTAAFTASSAYEVPLTFSTGLTRTTNTITANAVNLAASGSGGVTGTLPIGNGGTGQATANTALNALLPTQTGHPNTVLASDGSNTSWGGFPVLDPIATMPTSGSLAPSDLTFSYNNSKRIFELISPNFKQIDGSEFKALTAPWRVDIYSVSGGSPTTKSWTSTGQNAIYTASGGAVTYITDAAPLAPYCFDQLTVSQLASTGQSTSRVSVGLFEDPDLNPVVPYAQYLIASYDIITGNVFIAYRHATTVVETQLASASVGTLTPPFTLGLSVTNRVASAWLQTGGQWRHIVDAWVVPSTTGYPSSIATVDMGLQTTIAKYRYGYFTDCEGGAGQTVITTDFKAGYFQGTAQLMWNPIRFLNGAPYIVQNKAYYTVDNQAFHPGTDAPTLASKWYANTHLGIYTKDLTTGIVEEIGKVFFLRATRLGDADASIAIDEKTLDIHIVVPNSRDDWMVTNQVLYYAKTNGDILHGINVVPVSTRLWLGTLCTPTGDTASSYDAASLFRYSNGDFGLVCITTNETSPNFDGSLLRYPSSFRSASMTAQMSLVNRYTSVTSGGEEGGRTLTILGTQYACFGAAGSIHIYDIGCTTRLASPAVVVHGVSQRTHYGIVEWSGNGVTTYDLTAFDFMDYNTTDPNGPAYQNLHGNVVSFRAAQTLTGYEFPIIRSPY